MNDLQDYLARGRALETVTLEDLNSAWCSGLRKCIDNPLGKGAFREMTDAQAEMSLRKVEPSGSNVFELIQALGEKLSSYEAQLSPQDRDRQAELLKREFEHHLKPSRPSN